MMNVLNSDPTLLMIGAGGLLVVLVVIFQIMTRPPAQKGKETDEAAGQTDHNTVRILSRKVLDDRRSLVSIRFGHKDHLLLLGEDGDLLIESRPTPLRDRHPEGPAKARNTIGLPFPPQPMAKLNTRTTADYQATTPIAVPDFLQTRAGQQAYAQPPQAPTPSSQHPVMPQAVQRQPVEAPAPQPAAYQPPPPMAPPPVMAPPPAYDPTEAVTRKLEEAMRQAHPVHTQPAPQAHQTNPHQPNPQPPGPQGGVYAASGPEAFEDEIRKLLGRGPHVG